MNPDERRRYELHEARQQAKHAIELESLKPYRRPVQKLYTQSEVDRLIREELSAIIEKAEPHLKTIPTTESGEYWLSGISQFKANLLEELSKHKEGEEQHGDR